MRKVFFILFSIMIIAGCSSNTGNNNTGGGQTVESKTQNAPTQVNSKQNEYQPNPQVTDDRSLQEVNQTFADDKGEAVLKDIKNVNKTFDIGPIELTIRKMKLIHLRPDYSMIDYFHVLTHDEEFDFVKVFVEIKNKSSEKVSFAPIALLKTNTGETFDWKKDIYLEELSGKLEGNAAKAGNLGFIVNAASGHAHYKETKDSKKTKDMKWIEITTSDVFDKNHKKISAHQKIKIKF
ncbi:hypothetical protein PJ311_14235 [Bacillus sp. CLL-7-23]|uniref:DUF4352 domain-containing protein n=1 Tax=Bacillus changyiensis TaxID=3004103 RepID=A0ABT4X624_9BACI|nr:hypothetical protein [Bacillus changyiensis]MDA7027740.1 hypothetical protein [Bacillus changyiensis]